MDFDAPLMTTCQFCNEPIKGTPLQGRKVYCDVSRNATTNDISTEVLMFCDMCCAKIYSDNVHRIVVNSHAYNIAYCRHQLSNNAMDIYDQVGTRPFAMMPLYIINDLPISDAKEVYRKTLLMIKR